MGRYEDFMEYRKQGWTYTEIAAKFGVSHQRVARIMAQRNPNHFRPYKPSEVVYDGLREWMNEHRISKSDLGRILNGTPFPGGAWVERFRKRLNGETAWRMCKIEKLIDASGLTYEQLFRSGRWCGEDGAAQGV